MGRGDNRRSPKMVQRISRRKYKARIQRRRQTARAEREATAKKKPAREKPAKGTTAATE